MQDFDTIIIGGGLSGLTAGIALARGGQRVAIATSGTSTLNCFSGSFDLLGYDDKGKEVQSPLSAAEGLPATHPYAKVGVSRLGLLADKAADLLREAGISVSGKAEQNHHRITPMGIARPAWLTIDGCLTADQVAGADIVLVDIEGFLDFPVEFIKAGLEQMGAKVSVISLQLNSMRGGHSSPYETRATSIARILTREEALRELGRKINSQFSILNSQSPTVVLPAVISFDSLEMLKEMVGCPMRIIATLPPSQPGMYVQTQLRNYFTSLGGEIFHDAKVTSGMVPQGMVEGIATGYSGNVTARSYVLATGSFQSHGLIADYRKVSEPIFGLDVVQTADDGKPITNYQRTTPDIFQSQPFMQFGVATDEKLHPILHGVRVDNLYAVGSILSGHDGIRQADATGVSLITALAAAQDILSLPTC
ncbi:MAG: anaerobic glycerol-3-phosphate dehydrogenase subunit B [Bacteroidaceae bacterium]|nr:anaerobic glycerol-3-phosphate dehydrogenase subunit B [Bacteroidaceae bacterium]